MRSDWLDPEQCRLDHWENQVYPTDKALRTARSIRSIDNDIDHAIAALGCAIDQVDDNIPDNQEWDAWRSTYFVTLTNALSILKTLEKMRDDITDVVMWEMVQKPDWFKTRKEEEGDYRCYQSNRG